MLVTSCAGDLVHVSVTVWTKQVGSGTILAAKEFTAKPFEDGILATGECGPGWTRQTRQDC